VCNKSEPPAVAGGLSTSIEGLLLSPALLQPPGTAGGSDLYMQLVSALTLTIKLKGEKAGLFLFNKQRQSVMAA
jgi:hypothetical protein